jgi:hypothetical protein
MTPSTLQHFPSILFIAGGTGIAVALSYLSALFAQDSDIDDAVTSIHIVWAIREHGILDHVLERDFPALAVVLGDQSAATRARVRVRITVHVTQDAELKDDIAAHGGIEDLALPLPLQVSEPEVASSNSVPDPPKKHNSLTNVKLKTGRPNVSAAVSEAALDAGRCGGLAVVACGPSTMADDARTACVRVLGEGYRGVEYFEESFKW